MFFIYFKTLFPFKHIKTDSHSLIGSLSWLITTTTKLREFPLRMYLVGVRGRDTLSDVCRVTCLGLLSQDGKPVFPLPQQRKSLDRPHLLFCPFRTVTDMLRVGSQTNTTCSTRPCDIPSYHVSVPFMGQLHNVVFQEPLLWISWMSDVIRLAVKGAVVVCP